MTMILIWKQSRKVGVKWEDTDGGKLLNAQNKVKTEFICEKKKIDRKKHQIEESVLVPCTEFRTHN